MNQGTHFSGQPMLAQIMKLIPRSEVNQLARTYGTDRYYKKFKTYDHLVTMLYAVFNKCTSLREVVTGMMACENKLYHVGMGYTPRRSTLSDANRDRNFEVFRAIHGFLYRQYAGDSPDSHNAKWLSRLYIADSTTISLFQAILKTVGRTPANGKRKGGVKAHTLIKADEDVPRLVNLTPATQNDRTFMKQIDLPSGSIIAMDKGYVNYDIFNRWSKHGISFVTRLSDNMVWTPQQVFPVDDDERAAGVISDRSVLLGSDDQSNKVKARLITFRDEEKKRTFTFLTNNFEMAPSTIARIYKQRWQIETLFKRLKQTFPLKYFLGDNVNAIKIQIWCVLIADLLLKIIHRTCQRKWSYANLASMVRLHLTTYIDLMSFLRNPEKALIQRNERRKTQPQQALFPT